MALAATLRQGQRCCSIWIARSVLQDQRGDLQDKGQGSGFLSAPATLAAGWLSRRVERLNYVTWENACMHKWSGGQKRFPGLYVVHDCMCAPYVPRRFSVLHAPSPQHGMSPRGGDWLALVSLSM